MVSVEDDAAFTVADGMTLGSVVNGNLRMVVKTKGQEVAIELPHKWLHGEGGLRHFIEANCKPDSQGTKP
jgi:hypothetical protein